MEVESISRIMQASQSLERAISSIKAYDYDGYSFGEEGEYSAKAAINECREAITEVKTLCNSHKKFLKISTKQERILIANAFREIESAAKNENIEDVCHALQKLKPILRTYDTRTPSESRALLQEIAEKLHAKTTTIYDEFNRVKETNEASLAIHSKLESLAKDALTAVELIKEKEAIIDKDSDSVKLLLAEMEAAREATERGANRASQAENEALSSKIQIEEFLKRISSRELQLDDQEQRTTEHSALIDAFRADFTDIKNEAQAIIETARTALAYRTAEGLSAAFTERYNDAKDDKSRKNWLIAAGIMLGCAVGIGIWVTLDHSVTLAVVAGRLTLIPILVGGVWFCAKQYVRQLDLAEEYAYKSILSKSLVGFSEQMSKENNENSDHSIYIRTVLAQIHTNPLKPALESPKPAGDAVSLDHVEKIAKMVADLQKLVKPS